MVLELSDDQTIQDIQHEFATEFPFLKLESYPLRINGNPGGEKTFPSSLSLKQAGLSKSGRLEIERQMTVLELENSLLQQFGLGVQVWRRSGMIWLQTTMTNNWTLQNQNEHGREISLSVNQLVSKDPADKGLY